MAIHVSNQIGGSVKNTRVSGFQVTVSDSCHAVHEAFSYYCLYICPDYCLFALKFNDLICSVAKHLLGYFSEHLVVSISRIQPFHA